MSNISYRERQQNLFDIEKLEKNLYLLKHFQSYSLRNYKYSTLKVKASEC